MIEKLEYNKIKKIIFIKRHLSKSKKKKGKLSCGSGYLPHYITDH